MTVWMTHQEWFNGRGYDDQCGGTLRITDQSEPIWIVACDACTFTAGLPAHKASPEIRQQLLIEQAEFPAMFAGKEFESTVENDTARSACREWVRSYPERPVPAPALWGLNGRGKSHLMAVVCEQLIVRHNVSVWFQTLALLMDKLMMAFEMRGEYERLWTRATTIGVLALDDIGAERVTDWKSERLGRLIDERYQNNRPVMLATNYPPDAWDQTIGARAESRLAEMTFSVEMTGHDRRKVTA